MLFMECSNIKKYYGDRLILDIENFKIYSKDRIGIVGLNGAGKSTLLDILCEKIKPEEGWVKIYTSFSYVTQMEDAEIKAISKEDAKRFGVSEKWNSTMSGGEKTRFKLAEALKKENALLFADEPTTNLDIEGIEMLQDKFQRYTGAIVVISHDREFLDKICTKILEVEDGKIRIYNGNYTEYKTQKENQRERSRFEYEQYDKEKKKLEAAMEKAEHKVKGMKKAPSRMGNSEARLHRKMGNQKAKANLDKAIKGMQSRIDHLEIKEKPKDLEKMKMDVLDTEKLHSKVLLSGKNITKAFGSKILFQDASLEILNGAKAALIGPNGCGKSTLLKMILAGTDGIQKAQSVKIGYFSQNMDILNPNLTILENVLEDSIYDETFARILLSRLLFKREEVYKKVSILSGGEKVKASFAKIFLQDFNLLILDEPTNYLDIYSMEAVEGALEEYNRTLLFVSHDRRFISAVANQIIEVRDKKLPSFQGTYEEYLERTNVRLTSTEEEKANRQLLLQNRLSEVIGRLSMPSKKDNVEELDKEYHEILKELQILKK